MKYLLSFVLLLTALTVECSEQLDRKLMLGLWSRKSNNRTDHMYIRKNGSILDVEDGFNVNYHVISCDINKIVIDFQFANNKGQEDSRVALFNVTFSPDLKHMYFKNTEVSITFSRISDEEPKTMGE